jgi:hypothetical protein
MIKTDKYTQKEQKKRENANLSLNRHTAGADQCPKKNNKSKSAIEAPACAVIINLIYHKC